MDGYGISNCIQKPKGEKKPKGYRKSLKVGEKSLKVGEKA